MTTQHFFRESRLLGLAILSLAMLSSCGYSFKQKTRNLPGDYRLVAVPVFKNQTQETGIETYFTSALKTEIHRSDLAEVAEGSVAPVTIEGIIDNVSYRRTALVTGVGDDTEGQIPALPVNSRLATDYRINLSVTLRIIRNSDRREIWQARFHGERSYLAPQIGTESINSSNALYNHSARLQNIEIIAKDLMNEAYSRMTENF